MKIFSIIICYKPDINNLIQLCKALNNEQSAIIIVDNTEESYISDCEDLPEYTFIALGMNTGIAHAQNVGIRHAVKGGADIIVLFDQDSVIERDFLSSLLAPLRAGEARVVAPVIFDNEKGYEFPSFRLKRFGLPVKVYRGNRSTAYNVDIITSSGTAATVATFDFAGFMDEEFFIDFVDIEWSLRCRKIGITIQVVPTAVMRHSIGEKSINIGFIRGFVHSPERCYYRIRNCFILFKKGSVPFLLATKEIISAFLHHIILIAFVKNRIFYIKNYYFAILHGIRGIVGKRPT